MEVQKKILIIDDEADTRAFFQSVLEDNGYKVETATNGEEGLNSVASFKPDLVTLDITMPGTSGVKCYRGIKESETTKSIPVLIITGMDKSFEQFISSRKQVPPPEGYLAKPVEPEQLLAEVNKLLGVTA